MDGQAEVDGGVDAVLSFLAKLRADVLEAPDAPHSALGHVLATRLPGVLSPSERLFVEAIEGALADAVSAATHQGKADFDACLERGLVALDVLKRHGPPPNIRIYRQLVLAASRGGRPALALHLLEETQQLGLALDLRCVHALVDTLPAEYAAQAYELLTQLEAPLDVGAVNSLLWRAAELSAGPPDARAMLVHSLLSALRERGIGPDELTLAACVTALGRASRLDDALAVWTHLLAAGVVPGQRSWAALLSACRDAEQHEMCWSLFCTLQDEKSVPLTKSGTRILYNIAIDSAVRSQQYARAFSLADAMTSAGVAPDLVTRNTLLPAFAATAGLHAAVERAQAPAFGADVLTWTRIMELAAQEGQPGVAADALEAIQRAGCVPDVVAWTTLIRAHGSDAREAVITWRQMRAAGVKPDAHTFQALLRCSMRANDPALASRVYAAMRSAGMGPNNRLFRELVSTSADAALSAAAAPSPGARESKAVLPPTPRWMPDGLDLHGLSSTEARAAVLCALRDLRDSGSRAPRGGLAVITGRGSNNPQGLAVLRDEVLRLCSELRLPCSVDEHNPGRVRVPSGALQAWLKRTSQLPHS